MNYNKYILLIFSVLMLINCKKSTVYKKVEYGNDEFLKNSQQNYKTLHAEEKTFIKSWIAKHPDTNFSETTQGFWVNVSKDAKTENAKKTDIILYDKQIEDFSGNIIYNFQEKTNQKLILGKSYEIRGVEYAMYNLSEGDEATLLIPSSLAYGLYGDEEKIGENIPIIVHLKVNKITKNN